MPLCNWCRSEAEVKHYVPTGLFSGEWLVVGGQRDESLPLGLNRGERCSRCDAEPGEEKKPARIAGVPP